MQVRGLIARTAVRLFDCLYVVRPWDAASASGTMCAGLTEIGIVEVRRRSVVEHQTAFATVAEQPQPGRFFSGLGCRVVEIVMGSDIHMGSRMGVVVWCHNERRMLFRMEADRWPIQS
jgi:hypothetical protein